MLYRIWYNMNIPQEKYFLKLREENTFFVVHKYQTLCPGICWGAINVISNNKCEWSNVENIIPPPVKVLQGPSRNINGKRPAEGISRRGLHFSWLLEQETFHIPDLTIVSKNLRFIRLFHYNIQISKCCSVRPAFPTPNSLLENFSITQVSLIVTWRKLPN